jgi:hypothetical protein
VQLLNNPEASISERKDIKHEQLLMPIPPDTKETTYPETNTTIVPVKVANIILLFLTMNHVTLFDQ